MTAIDLGSNTFRVVRFECEKLEPAARFEKIVRTADGLIESGRIEEGAIERIVEAAKEAEAKIGLEPPIVAVTTEAIRRAKNASEVLRGIEEATGIAFRVIGGEEEAALTLLAVRTRLQKLGVGADRFVMVDIGGGSTEILFFQEGELLTKSFPLGIVTIAQRYKRLERIEAALPKESEAMERFVQEAKARGYKPALLVATAGTPTTVAAMKLGMDYETYDPDRVNGTLLGREDLQMQLRRLLALEPKARQKLVGVGREDLIAAGILIFDRIYEILGFSEATVIDDGLREGVAIATCRGELSATSHTKT